MAPVLGYWKLRGLAEPIRYVLWQAGVEYEEKMYEMSGSPGAWSRDDWLSVKDSIDVDFPNLPYWIDGDVKISESLAIIEHLARKHGLLGEGEKELVRLGMTRGIWHDLNMEFTMMAYKPNFEELKKSYVPHFPSKVAKISKLLGQAKYILGDKISYCDFLIFELLERWLVMFPEGLQPHANLTAFHQRMSALPAIVKYRASPAGQAVAKRWNNKSAQFGTGV